MEDEIIYKSPFGIVYENEMTKVDTPDEFDGDRDDNVSRVFILGRDWMRVSLVAEKGATSKLFRYDNTPLEIVTLWGHVNHERKCLDKFVAAVGNSIDIGGNARIVSLLDGSNLSELRTKELLAKIFLSKSNVEVTGE